MYDKIICKKTFVTQDKIIFEKGKTYEYWYHSNSSESIYINYEDFYPKQVKHGYTFYKKINSNRFGFLISDYFCTLPEIRKLKLDKLNLS